MYFSDTNVGFYFALFHNKSSGNLLKLDNCKKLVNSV